MLLAALSALPLMNACSVMKHKAPPLTSIEGMKGHFAPGRIIELETGLAISFDDLIDRLGAKDLIFIGEKHDNPEHHLIEAQILQALAVRYGPVSAAMEFFQEPGQPALDRYLSGAIDEALFLKEVGWKEGWSFHYHFYRPLLLTIKERGGKVLAINAPRSIVRKVAREGLSGLDQDERIQLAEDIDLGNRRHREYVKRVFKEHVHPELKNFEHFYQAQCVWEDTMAQNIAEHMQKCDDRVVAFTGNGHIVNKFGIPDRTRKRVAVSMATLVLYPVAQSTVIQKEAADYVWITGNHSGSAWVGKRMPGSRTRHHSK